MAPIFNIHALNTQLNDLIAEFDSVERRAHDPVDLVWNYTDAEDQEVVALITSCLAYGRVELLKRAVADVLDKLGPHPAEFLRQVDTQSLPDVFEGFTYRMSKGADVADLLAGVAAQLHVYGSLEKAYLASSADSHLGRASDLVRSIRAGRIRQPVERGLRYLLPDPRDGSTCKRLHLFFRWVSRGPDTIDLGIWSHLSPADLIMPLDTHTSRLCRYIGLTERNTVDGKMADQVTASLRLLDANDPLRFDFALCHLGISRRCIHRRSDDHCPGCPIEEICML